MGDKLTCIGVVANGSWPFSGGSAYNGFTTLDGSGATTLVDASAANMFYLNIEGNSRWTTPPTSLLAWCSTC